MGKSALTHEPETYMEPITKRGQGRSLVVP
jgi:hypothetical protein